MATLYATNGADNAPGISLSSADIEARLLERGFGAADVAYYPGPPRFERVMRSPEYVVVEIHESEPPSTTLFPKAGFYHLHKLSVSNGNADFLLKPAKQ